MDENNEKMSCKSDFKDWVDGGIQLTKPWKWALILTNFFWAAVLLAFIWFAYMSPETSYQHQDIQGEQQTQSYGTELPAEAKG